MVFPIGQKIGTATASREPGRPTLFGKAETARAHHIVALGGGTGLPAVLEGLADLAFERGETDPHGVTGIVTVTDDGGSLGRLRQQFWGVAARRCAQLSSRLTDRDSRFKELLPHRLDEGPGVVGHPIGNLPLAALTQATGDFAGAVHALGRAMEVRGQVLPATARDVRLRAEFHGGEFIDAETSIVSHRARVSALAFLAIVSSLGLPHW